MVTCRLGVTLDVTLVPFNWMKQAQKSPEKHSHSPVTSPAFARRTASRHAPFVHLGDSPVAQKDP